MAWALVGTIGTAVQGTSGNSVSPSFGASENRTKGNMLVLFCSVTGTATLPTTPAGWSIARQRAGTSCSTTVFIKPAAGSDAAPTVAGITSGLIAAQLAEYSGVLSTAVDRSGDNVGTASPVTATNAGADAATNELMLIASADRRSVARASNDTLTSNHITSVTQAGNNNGVSSTDHYSFGYGTINSIASADTSVVTLSITTSITGIAIANAVFKLGVGTPVQTLTLDAIVKVNKSSSFTLDAYVKPTIMATFACGFECRVARADGGSQPHWDGMTGSPSIDTTTFRSVGSVSGAASLLIDTTGGAASTFLQRPTYAAGTRMRVGRFYVRIGTNVGTRTGIVVATGSNGMRIGLHTTGAIYAQAALGTVQDSASTYNDGNWHRVDYRFDRSGSTATVSWKVDGVAQTDATSVVAAADMSTLRVGLDGSTTAKFWIDDFVESATSLDFPIGAGRVLGHVPIATGTHSFTSGDFQDDASANLATNETTSWQKLDELPAASADHVKQVVIRSTGYLEYDMEAAKAKTIRAVEVIATVHNVSTGADTQKAVLYDGTTASDAYLLGSAGSVAGTLRAQSGQFPITPSNLAWTKARFDALRVRWGYSDDVTTNPALDGLLIEVEFPDEITGTLTLNAIVKANRSSSLTLDAIAKKKISGSFSLDAMVATRITSSFTLNAIVKKSVSGSFSLDAIVKKTIIRDEPLVRDSQFNSAAASTSISVTTPSVVAGDAIFIVVFVPNVNTSSFPAVTGYTSSFTIAGPTGSAARYHKIADGTEGGTTFSLTGLSSGDWYIAAVSLTNGAHSFGTPASGAAQIVTTSTSNERALGGTFLSDSLPLWALFFPGSLTLSQGNANSGAENPGYQLARGVSGGYTLAFWTSGPWTQNLSPASSVHFSPSPSAGSNFYQGLKLPLTARPLTINAIVKQAISGSFTLNAIVKKSLASSFALDAYISAGSTHIEQSFTLDALVRKTRTGSFTLNAIVGRQLVYDTFTRTLSGTWGTSDNGFEWGSGAPYHDGVDYGSISVDGASGVVTSGAVEGFAEFRTVPRPRLVLLTYRITIPTTEGDWPHEISLVESFGHRTDMVDGYFLSAFVSSSTLELIAFGQDIDVPHGVAPGETWWVKWYAEVPISNISGGGITRAKAWKNGDPEPDWEQDDTSSGFGAGSDHSFYIAIAQNSDPAHIDDLSVIDMAGDGWLAYRSFPIEAVVKARIASSFTLNAIVKKSRSSSLTFDALVKKNVTATVTVDAIVKKSVSQSATANAIVRVSRASTFTANAIVRKSFSASATADAIVKAARSGSATADAIVRASRSSSATLNAIVRASRAGSFSLDAWVRVSRSQTLALDAIVRARLTRSLTADAIVHVNRTGSLTVDTWVRASRSGSASADAIVRQSRSQTFTANLWVAGGTITGFGVDAIVKARVSSSLTADAIVRKAFSGSSTVNAWVRTQPTSTFTVNAIVKARVSQAATADALVKRTQTGSATANAIVKTTRAGSFSANAIVRAARATTFTVNAIAKARVSSSATANAIVRANRTGSATANAIVKRTRSATFSVDGYVIPNTITATFSINAIVRTHHTSTFAANAIARRTQSGTVTIDGLVRAHRTSSVTVAAWIKQQRVGSATADAVVRSTRTVGFAVDAYVILQHTQTFTVDSYVRDVVTQAFTAAAIVQATGSGSFSIGSIVTISRPDAIVAVLEPLDTLSASITLDTISASLTLDYLIARPVREKEATFTLAAEVA